MDSNGSGYHQPTRISWFCEKGVKTEANIQMGRVVGYRRVPIDGCGSVNKPGSRMCWNCGKVRNGDSEETVSAYV